MRRLRNFGCHMVTSRYSLQDLIGHVQFLDKGGFDVVTIGDHTLIPNSAATYPNAQTVLGYLARVTERCRISPAVTDPLRRHPVEIAQAALTVDQLTRGRGMLGLGAGEMMNLEPFGLEWSKPFTRLREAVEVIQLLWSSSPKAPVDYQGEFFNLSRAYLQITPYEVGKAPPLYIGAVGRKTRELVGERTDGWIPVIESPSSLRVHLEDIRRGAQRAGRDPEAVDTMVTFYTEVGDDREAALRTVEPVARMQLVQERSVVELTSGISIPRELSVQRLLVNDPEVTQNLHAVGASLPRKVVEDVTVIGTVEECIKKVETFLDSGATSFLVVNLGKDQEGVFRSYSERIIPYLKENYGE